MRRATARTDGAGGRWGWREIALATASVVCSFLILEVFFGFLGVEAPEQDPFIGFAGDSRVFVPDPGMADRGRLVTAPSKLTLFNPQSFSRKKDNATFRIFCLGGSTTFGRPYDDRTSFAGWLREFLPVADPTRTWEVVNAGGVSYASYRVGQVMEESAAYEPDLFIVYTGQNEFLEERTYREIRELPMSIRRVIGVLAKTRTWAGLSALLRRSGVSEGPRTADRHMLPAEVEAKLDRSGGLDLYERDDELRSKVLFHYEYSLQRMVDISRAAGAELIFVKPASNHRDCLPFKSQHSAGMTEAQMQRSRQLLEAARNRIQASDWLGTLALLDEALALDPRYAELHYRRGRALFEVGRHDEARAAFSRALVEDVCPLRALPEMEEALSEVAGRNGVPVVDFPELLESRLDATEGHRILGEEDFLDHVHPTVEAHRTLALAIVETMTDQGLLSSGTRSDSQAIDAVIADVEGRIDPEEHAEALASLAWTLEWAGKYEESQRLALRALETGYEHPRILLIAARHAAADGRMVEARDLYYRSLRADPLSPTAHYQVGLFAIQTGSLDLAAGHFLLATALWPEDPKAHEKLGLVLAEKGRLDLALGSLNEARRRNPGVSTLTGVIEKVERLAGTAGSSVRPASLSVTRYPSGAAETLSQVRTGPDGRSEVHGVQTEWYQDGRLKSYREYVSGEPVGNGRSWGDAEGNMLGPESAELRRVDSSEMEGADL